MLEGAQGCEGRLQRGDLLRKVREERGLEGDGFVA